MFVGILRYDVLSLSRFVPSSPPPFFIFVFVGRVPRGDVTIRRSATRNLSAKYASGCGRKGVQAIELKFHYSATRAELVSSENRWYVTFVMIDSAPIVHEFSSRHDAGDPTFDWQLADQTSVIDHFEERLRAAGYHPVRSGARLPPLVVAAWTLAPTED